MSLNLLFLPFSGVLFPFSGLDTLSKAIATINVNNQQQLGLVKW